jgi:hypothetical protein
MKFFSNFHKNAKEEPETFEAQESDYSFSLGFDTRGGQPVGNFSVSCDGENIIFDYYNRKKINRRNAEGSKDYLLLASLVAPSKRANKDYASTRMAEDALCYFYLNDIDYVYASEEELIKVATKLGPLFGRYGVQKNAPVVIESKESWYSAAKIINFCLRAEGALFKPKENLGSVDDDLFYYFAISDQNNFQLIATKTFDWEIPHPYRSLLVLNSEQMESLKNKRTFSKGAFYRAFWEDPDRKNTRKNVLAIFVYQGTRFKKTPKCIPLSGFDLREMFEKQHSSSKDFDPETEHTAEESLIETLIQSLIYLHVAKVKLNWGVVEDNEGSANASLDFCFDCYLQRIWYELGQAHSGKIIRICEQCGKAFVAENNTNASQRFCSESCQIKAKKLRQKKREKAIADLVKELKRDFSFSDEEAFKQYVAIKMRPYYHSDSDLNRQLDSLAEKILIRVKRK